MDKSYKKLGVPYLIWLYLFALLPILIMLLLCFMEGEGLDFQNFSLTWSNFTQLGEKSTLVAFWNSIWISVLTTIVSAIVGYIVAYKLFRSKLRNKYLVLVILILPMWSNLLLRTEALGNVMEGQNILNDLLSKIGLSFQFNVRGSYLSVLIGLVLTYMPFMVLPIYTALEKIHPSLEEAALDLGLTDFQKFWKVVFPLSSKGIVTGSIMVLLPCMSGFAIPQILGNGNIVLIGNVIDQMYQEMNYNVGSLLGMIIVIVITGAILIINKTDKEGGTLI